MWETVTAAALAPKNKGMSAPKRMGGQSGYNAPRMTFVPGPMGAMAVPTRPPLIANKARGTISSANRVAMGGMF
jgi:hypothetical protein